MEFLKSWVGHCQRGSSDKVWRAAAVVDCDEGPMVIVEFGRRWSGSQLNHAAFATPAEALDYFDAKVCEKLRHGYLPGSWLDRRLFQTWELPSVPRAQASARALAAPHPFGSGQVGAGCDLGVVIEMVKGRTALTELDGASSARHPRSHPVTLFCPEEPGRLAVVIGEGGDPWYGVAACDASWGRHSVVMGSPVDHNRGMDCCGQPAPLIVQAAPTGEVRATLVHRTSTPLYDLLPRFDVRLTRRRPPTDEVAMIGEREGDRLHVAGALIHRGTTTFLWVDGAERPMGRVWDGRDEAEVRQTPELAITRDGICMPIAARQLMNGHEAALRSAMPLLQPHLISRRLQSL